MGSAEGSVLKESSSLGYRSKVPLQGFSEETTPIPERIFPGTEGIRVQNLFFPVLNLDKLLRTMEKEG